MGNNMNQQPPQVKMPREHPILRNIFSCILVMCVVLPLIISLISFGMDMVGKKDQKKTEQIVGRVTGYKVDTNSNGNAIWYYTDVEFELNSVKYNKTLKTRYYVAEPNEYVKLYHEKGNPMSASPTKSDRSLTILDKLSIFRLLAICTIILFVLKAIDDMNKYRERKNQFAQMQQYGNNLSKMINMNNNFGNNSINNFNNTNGW